MNENCTTAGRMHELEALRELERPQPSLAFPKHRIKQQAVQSAGRFFALENSAKSRIWDEPPVIELMRLQEQPMMLKNRKVLICRSLDLRPMRPSPGASKTLPAAVKASVARLHLNTGHAHKKELIRLLSSYGSINSATLTAINHMVCGSCERTKPPAPPRPASIPQFMGQFGERVQVDIVYIRDLSGSNHPVLGMVDMATLLQQAVRLHSRASAHVADQFRRSWLMPYGYPLVCEVDADGAFEGDFRTALEDAGVHYVVIPPEAPWRIGTVERRNAVLRTAAERLIDENAVTNGEGVDWILISTVQALNSSTATKGRSPYQAVFGRLPRFPGDLMSDDRAMIVSDHQMLAEELRQQALRVISETRASQVIRRALLRKTKPNKEESQAILPGSLAAYWRWTKRAAGKKKGGYVLGRLLPS